MKVKYIVFDFDGTLFDSMSIWDTAGELYLQSMGKQAKPSLREEVRELSLHQSAVYLKREYGLDESEEEIIRGIHQTIEDFYRYEVRPKAGVLAFLKELREAGMKLCIATASDRSLIEGALKRCGVFEFFDQIFTCSEVGHGKDEPMIFRKAMEYFQADRGNVVVFEDAFYAARTAKQDGFMTVAVFDKSEERQRELQQMCDCYLTDFEHTDIFWKFASV